MPTTDGKANLNEFPPIFILAIWKYCKKPVDLVARMLFLDLFGCPPGSLFVNPGG